MRAGLSGVCAALLVAPLVVGLGCNPGTRGNAGAPRAQTGATGGETPSQVADFELSLFDLPTGSALSRSAAATASVAWGDANKDVRGTNLAAGVAVNAPHTVEVLSSEDEVLFGGTTAGGRFTGRLAATQRQVSKPMKLRVKDADGTVQGEMLLPSRRDLSGRFRLNMALRRDAEKTMIAEFSPQQADGSVDREQPRMIVDNGWDVDGDNEKESCQRMDFSDGTQIYDADLDGVFGSGDDIWDEDNDKRIGPGEGALTSDPTVGWEVTAEKNADGTHTLLPATLGVREDAIASFALAANPAVLNDPDTPVTLVLVFKVKRGFPPFGATVALGLSSGVFSAGGLPSQIVTLKPPQTLFNPDKGAVLRLGIRAPATIDVPFVTVTATIVRSDGPVTLTLDLPVVPRQVPELQQVATRTGSLSDVVGGPVVIEGRNFSDTIEDVVVSFGGVQATVIATSTTRIQTTIPVGAQTGPITVEVNGKSATTKDVFTVLPGVDEVSPAAGADNVDPTAPLGVNFTDTITGLAASDVRLLDPAGAAVTLTISPAGAAQAYVLTPTAALAENTTYRLTIERYNVSQVFTTGSAPDVTPPAVQSYLPASGSVLPAETTELAVLFTEPIDPTSVNRNTLALTATGLLITGRTVVDRTDRQRLTYRITESLDTASGVKVGGLLAGTTYTLTVSSALRDLGNNTLGSGNTAAYTTAASIDAIQPVVGLPGSEVVCTGGVFPTGITGLTATYNGAAVPVLFSSARRLILRVPETAASGSFTITFGETTLTSPTYTVTDELAELARLNLDGEAYELAQDRARNLVYVVVQNRGLLVEFNGLTGVATGRSIILPGKPTDVKYDRDNDRLLVPNFGRETSEGSSLSIVDRANFSVVKDVPCGLRPTRVAIDRLGGRAFVSNYADGTVTALDVKTGEFLGRFEVGLGPNGIAITPDGKKGYVANYQDGTVTVFSLATLQVLTDIAVGLGPSRVVIGPAGRTAFVTNFDAGTISVIDLATDAVRNTLDIGAGPLNIAFAPDGNAAVVSLRSAGALAFLIRDIETNRWSVDPTRLLAVGKGPAGVAISSNGATLMVTLSQAQSFAVFALQKPAPAIEQVSRLTADPGAKIVLTGTGFDFDPAQNAVTLGTLTLPVDPTDSNAGRIAVTLPTTKDDKNQFLAQSGDLTVTRDGRVSNDVFLEVTPLTPTLRSIDPLPGTTGLALESSVLLTFTEPMDRNSVKAGVVTLRPVLSTDPAATSPVGDALPLLVELGPAGRRLFVRPTVPLTHATKYRVRVQTSLKDLDGNAFDGDFKITGNQPFDFFVTTVTKPPVQVLVTTPTSPLVPGPDGTVTFQTQGWVDGTQVFVGGKAATATAAGDGVVTVVVPAGLPSGLTSVTFQPPGGIATVVAGSIYIPSPLAPLQVFSVTPRELPLNAGGQISVVGAGFTANTQFFLAGTALTPAAPVTDSLAILDVPPPSTQVLSAALEARDGTRSFTVSGAVFFIVPPSVLSVTPNAGPAAGGNEVRVLGSGFRTTDFFSFGSLPAFVVSFVSPSEVVLLVPPGAAGKVDLSVANPDGQSGTLSAAYEYFPEVVGEFGVARGAFLGGGVAAFIGPDVNALDFINAAGTRRTRVGFAPFFLPHEATGSRFRTRIGRVE